MKLVLLMAMMLVSSANFAAVGQNNFQFTVGGAMNYTTLGMNGEATAEVKKANKQEYLGAGFDVTLGYLYLSQGSLIHGFDTKARFAMTFSPAYKLRGERTESVNKSYQGLHTTSFSVGSTYMIGKKLNTGRLMVNVLGLNLGYLTGNIKQVTPGQTMTINNKTGNSFLVGIDLPLGTQYIFDNGFSVGFSHRLDFALGKESTEGDSTMDGTTKTNTQNGSQFGTKDGQQSYMAYNLTVSLGYVFGK